jgi:sugar phosphate permease
MSMFEVGGFFGSVTSGYISDKLVAKVTDTRHCLV